MTDKLKKITIEEWRQLGYHYYKDDDLKKWIITGSPFGIESFAIQLMQYSIDEKNDKLGEHDHWGPYLYLEIMTHDRPGMDHHAIFGTLSDIKRLSDIVVSKLKDTSINETILIKDEYTPSAEYSLELNVMEYGFDPSTCDKEIW